MTQKNLATRLRAIRLRSKQTKCTKKPPDFFFFTVSSNSGLPHPDNPYYGISESSFSEEITKVLLTPVVESDVEIKPDGEHIVFCRQLKPKSTDSVTHLCTNTHTLSSRLDLPTRDQIQAHTKPSLWSWGMGTDAQE